MNATKLHVLDVKGESVAHLIDYSASTQGLYTGDQSEAWGYFGARSVLSARFWTNLDPDKYFMPQGFFDSEGSLILGTPSTQASGGKYLVLEGIADVTMESQTNAEVIAALNALEDRPLTEAGRIVLESWTGDPQNGIGFSMVLTPDAAGAMTIGDVIQFATRVAPGRQGLLVPIDSMFDGEEVEIHLTAQNDSYALYNGFRAEVLTIDAGDGKDYVSIVGNDAEDRPQHLTIRGGGGNDALFGDAIQSLTLEGGQGNDLLSSDRAAGLFVAYGGGGRDEIRASQGEAQLFGGNGHDSIYGSQGSDTVYGGADNDLIRDASEATRYSIRYFSAANLVQGGGGNDTIEGGDGSDTLMGGKGNDQLWGARGDDEMIGGSGFDYYRFMQPDENNKTPLGDQTVRDSGGMIILSNGSFLGHGAMERIGDDLVLGELGTSSLKIVDFYLHPGAWVSGRALQDGPIRDPSVIDFRFARTLINEATFGSDLDDLTMLTAPSTHAAGAGDDSVKGSSQQDRILGEAGNDTIEAGGGSDLVLGGAGNDMLLGEGGDDSLIGGDGDDKLKGGNGSDILLGGAGNDLLAGQDGDDDLEGGAGNDTLIGGAGNDILRGGVGADVFEFARGDGRDKIMDFDPFGVAEGNDQSLGDHLRLSANLWAGRMTADDVVARFAVLNGGALVLDFGRGDVLNLGGFADRATIADAIEIFG